ncbi:hypothetical protein JCM10908_001331 [Rhodotorula pacifica]|uniref:uncharacterized protein n=1 Tax=Rhodotorula pacifica TaxID=1495444 RepID=UPI00316C67B8
MSEPAPPPAGDDTTNNPPSSLTPLDATTEADKARVWIDKETLLLYRDKLDEQTLSLDDAQIKALVEHGLSAHERVDLEILTLSSCTAPLFAQTASRGEKQLGEARAKIARLETELAHLPSLYASRAQLDLERVSSENDQLVVQARTLARKLSEAEEDKRRLSEGLAQGLDAVMPAIATIGDSTTTSKTTRPGFADSKASLSRARASLCKGKSKLLAISDGQPADEQSSLNRQQRIHAGSPPESEGAQAPDEDIDLERLYGDLDAEAAEHVDYLERENQALKIDKSALEARLKVAEQQITRAEQNLRDLRAGMLQGTPLVVVDHELALPPLPPSNPMHGVPPQLEPSTQLPPGKPRHVQLGDAEAELLLQAAKVQSHVNRINRVPLSRVIVEQAHEIVRAAPLVSRSNGSPTAPRFDTSIPAPSGRNGSTQVGDKTRIPTSTNGASLSTSNTNAGGSKTFDKENTNSLTQLAYVSSQEDVDLPPVPAPQLTMPAPVALLPLPPLGFVGSEAAPKKRRRRSSDVASKERASKRSPQRQDPRQGDPVQDATIADWSVLSPSDTDEDDSDHWLPRGGADRLYVPNEDMDHLPSPPAIFAAATASTSYPAGPSGTRSGKPLGQNLSALDVLAQASASQEAADYAHVPADGEAGPYSGKGAKGKMKADPDAKARSRSASSVGPDGKKARSPYIKWNVSEDEALIRAVIQCGCAWDSVAKLCPTRAYHQVRQRFLRGLKSGETLPPELMYLQPALLKSVQEYETKRKRKKLAKQAAQRLAEDAMLGEQ